MTSPFVGTSPFVVPELAAPRCFHVTDSPVGPLLLTARGGALTGVHMLDGPGPRPVPGASWLRRPRAFGAVVAQLAAYFAGELTDFDVPLAPSGTPFQLAVWAELTRIRYGATAAYGDVARAIGRSAAACRAVGAANGRNPISIVVPCHRVIGAGGALVGYGGGLDRKKFLLELESSTARPC